MFEYYTHTPIFDKSYFLAVHLKSFPFLNTRTTWKIIMIYVFMAKKRNLQFPNDLARRYVMWFDSKKREHIPTKRARYIYIRYICLLITGQSVTSYTLRIMTIHV